MLEFLKALLQLIHPRFVGHPVKRVNCLTEIIHARTAEAGLGLTGATHRQGAIKLAEKIASTTDGVREVDNQIRFTYLSIE